MSGVRPAPGSVQRQQVQRSLSQRQRRQDRKTILYLSAMMLAAAIVAVIVFILLTTGTIRLQMQRKVTIQSSLYGHTTDGQRVDKYVMRNKNGVEVQFITLGGAIVAITVPAKNGKMADVVLGYKDLKGYEDGLHYFGSLIGRVANRIANGTFTLDGATYHLDRNDGENHLHGGFRGWNKAVWETEEHNEHVVLFHTSRDGDAGYPGDVSVNVTYQLTEDNQFVITFTARARRKATPINLTSHPYFNLGGHTSGTILDHVVSIYADRYLVVSDTLIPTGVEADVSNTAFDLRKGRKLGDVIGNLSGGGFDDNFCLLGPTGKRRAARVEHPDSGRTMEVFTNQPGLQFYTANQLDLATGAKGGGIYRKHSGFCLESQNYPDAINHPSFPDCVLRPGSVYNHQVWYKFSVTAH